MKKTFLEILNYAKKKYLAQDDIVIFEIIFFLSKSVKNKSDFISKTNNSIDFSYRHFLNLLKQYFVAKKPLSHITGTCRFCKRDFIVCKKILAPRCETEILVKKVNEILKTDSKLSSIIDLCCGTGNIGITLKKDHPNLDLFFLDVNTKAIKNTIKNINLHKIKAQTINKNIFTFIKKPIKTDIVVCNPPYVSLSELDMRMVRYESKISFINSKTPLDFYLLILKNIKYLVNNQNHFLLAFEISPFIKKDIESVIDDLGLTSYTTWFKDLENNFRGFVVYRNI